MNFEVGSLYIIRYTKCRNSTASGSSVPKIKGQNLPGMYGVHIIEDVALCIGGDEYTLFIIDGRPYSYCQRRMYLRDSLLAETYWVSSIRKHIAFKNTLDY